MVLVNADFWLSLLGLGVTGLVCWLAQDYPSGARSFPLRVALLLAVGFACLLVKSVKIAQKEKLSIDWQASGVVLLSGAYLWGLSRWGYVISTAVFFLCTTLVLAYRRYVVAAWVSVFFSLGVYILFTKLLSVPLPRMTGGFF